MYFHTQDETIQAIMRVMRFSAVTNDVPDYYIYRDGKHIDTLEGAFLYNLYVENGGVTLGVEEHDLQVVKNKDKRIYLKSEDKNEYTVEKRGVDFDGISDAIHNLNNSLENLSNMCENITKNIERRGSCIDLDYEDK